MRQSIEAVAFDFDGLIVDTETPEYESWRSVYRAYGADLPLWTWLPHVGEAATLSTSTTILPRLQAVRSTGRRRAG